MRKQYRIRAAKPDEAGVLSALARDAKAMWGYPAEALAAWKDQLTIDAADVAARPFFVAEIDGAIAGFYALAPGAKEWELDNLWVAPALGRRGIGRALLKHALLQARLGGAERVLVDSDPHAEPFYLAAGGSHSGEVPAPIAGNPDRVRPQICFAVGKAVR